MTRQESKEARGSEATLREVSIRSDPWQRVRAGILVEQGLVSADEAQHWQETVRRGEFDPDACAREVLGSPVSTGAEERVERRTASLMRDLVMAPTLHGRATRRRTKTAAAMLLSQGYLLLVWGGIFLIAALVLRLRGVEFDAFLDGMLGAFD